MAEPAVRLIVTDDLERSRVTVFFRWLLAIPHLIAFAVGAPISLLLAFFQWLVVLFTGRPQPQLAEFHVAFVRYSVHLYAYLWLAAAPWPPFYGFGGYPVDVEITVAERQNRWKTGFRAILAFPAIMLAGALDGAAVSSGSGASYQSGLGPTAAFLGWFASLARGRMPRGLRDAVLYAIGFGAQTATYLFLLTDRYPDADPALVPDRVASGHPARLTVAEDDLRRNRLTVFFRLLLAVPHVVWLALWGVVVALAAIVGWLSALALGRLPSPLHRFLARYQRYALHVSAFLYLAGGPFPGFVGAPGGYPVDLVLPEPGARQGRWGVLFRLVLAVPAFLVSGALGGVAGIGAFLAWWTALFTGRIPLGLRNAILYAQRYGAEASAYASLLTPRYPFSGPGPEGF